MGKRLFILLLLTGLLPLSFSIVRKYYLIQQLRTWSAALTYCHANRAELATMESNNDLVKIQNLIKELQFTNYLWIGLYLDINSWRWSYRNESLGLTKWVSGEPNNGGGHEECATISSSGWGDTACTNIFAFICFDDRNSGISQYLVYSTPKLTWLDAQKYCRTYHSDLAGTRDNTEYSTVIGMISETTWIGLFRDSWKWMDQSQYFSFRWSRGGPEGGNENCGYLDLSHNIEDAACSYPMAFVCHREITGQHQIIRIKVNSDQDVNDPSLKTAILEIIQQKLMAHGMVQNIKLKWRQQPSGLVFYKLKKK